MATWVSRASEESPATHTTSSNGPIHSVRQGLCYWRVSVPNCLEKSRRHKYFPLPFRSVTFLFTFVLHNHLRWLHPNCQAGQCILNRGTFFYRFWKPGEPNLFFAEKCAAIHVKGNTDSNTYSNWNNILCSTSCYQICELAVKFVWGRCPGFGWDEVNFLHCSWYCSGTNCALEMKGIV